MSLTTAKISTPTEKFSKVYLHYVQPLMDQVLAECDTLPSGDMMEKLLRLPWMAWNIEVLSTGTSDVDYMASFRFQVGNDPNAIALINEYRTRKKTQFADYDVMLGDVVFTPTSKGHYHVLVKGHEVPTIQ